MEELISQLSEITGDWKILAEDLGVPRSRIERIQLDEHNTEHRRRAVLRVWYDSQEQPCWETVIRVLRGMGKDRLAGEIARCLSKGCHVSGTETRRTRDEDYSETTPYGYSTLTGTTCMLAIQCNPSNPDTLGPQKVS